VPVHLDIPVHTTLAMLRLGQTNRIIDPTTGEARLEDTDLVIRAKAIGMDEKTLLSMSKISERLKEIKGIDRALLPSLENIRPDGYTTMPAPTLGEGINRTNSQGNKKQNISDLSCRTLLDCLKQDVYNDVCSTQPLSSLNYALVTARFMILFTQFEKELSHVQNPLYLRAYDTDSEWTRHKTKRFGLTFLALSEQDDECLKIMAKLFQTP
jgi:hypothetical protein